MMAMEIVDLPIKNGDLQYESSKVEVCCRIPTSFPNLLISIDQKKKATLAKLTNGFLSCRLLTIHVGGHKILTQTHIPIFKILTQHRSWMPTFVGKNHSKSLKTIIRVNHEAQ